MIHMTNVDAVAAEFDLEARKYQRWSSGDLIRFIVGLVLFAFGLFLAAVARNTVGGFEQDIVSWFNRLPNSTLGAVIGLGQAITVIVPVVVFGLLLWRRLFRLIGMQFLATNLAALTVMIIESRYSDRLGVLDDSHSLNRGWIANVGFPTSAAVAAAAAFVTVAAPWLSKKWRRATWLVMLVLVLLRIVGSGEPPIDIVVALAMGVVSGSLILLVFGSPIPYQRASELIAALRVAGMTPDVIARASGRDATACFLVDTVDPQSRLFVKVRTPVDRSGDLLNRLWDFVRLRSSELKLPFSSLKRRAEHEAYAASVARDRGVSTPDVAALGETDSGSVFLAYLEVDAVPLAQVDPGELTRPVLNQLWSQLGLLRTARIAHRNLSLLNILIGNNGDLTIIDFDRAEVAADDRDFARDLAGLLVSVAARIGVDDTVSSAVEVLGPEVVAECLPQLQPLALAPDVRRLVNKQKSLIDELAAAARGATGAPEIELEKLERIKIRTVLMILAGSLAFYSLLPQLANIDQTADAVRTANLWWLPAVLAGSALTYVFATVSALGAYSMSLPVLATMRSQLASSFTALVAPANAGGLALGVRFLQKAGFKTSAASSAVGLNAVAGVVVHVGLLFAFVSWTGQVGVGNFELPSASRTLVVIAVVLALCGGLLLIRPIRHRVIGPIVGVLKSAGGHLGTVFTDPVRVLALFGGSLMVTLTYAATLAFSVAAFGGGISIPAICTAFLVAVTIATVAPTPGGIGAIEAAMIATLAGFGMDHGPAVGAVLTFRLGTFWLPILPGWYTFVWMERHGEI